MVMCLPPIVPQIDPKRQDDYTGHYQWAYSVYKWGLTGMPDSNPPVTGDFYCDEVLSGRTPVRKVIETDRVLAYHHTRPYWPVHIVVIPKQHIDSLIALGETDSDLLLELLSVVRQVAVQVVAEHGACRVVTNLGRYQESKHLHFHVGCGEPLR